MWLVATSQPGREPLDPATVRQWFYNPIECKDGYRAGFCSFPNPVSPNGLVKPIVGFYHDQLVAQFSEADGKWRVRQVAVCVRVPLCLLHVRVSSGWNGMASTASRS